MYKIFKRPAAGAVDEPPYYYQLLASYHANRHDLEPHYLQHILVQAHEAWLTED